MSGDGWLTRGAALTRSASRSAPLALALLIGANLIPLAGVLFFGWSVATVLYTYWIESGIVGLLNVPKMLLASGGGQPLSAVGAAGGMAGRVGLAAFFLAHYGIFWVVHGVFVTVLTGGFLAFGFGDPIGNVLADGGLLLAALALLMSHGASFLLNYVGRGEYRNATLAGQMFAPYGRVFALHIAIVLGGALVIGARQPEFMVALLVLVKIAFDLALHLRAHRGRALADPVRGASPTLPPGAA